VRKLAALAEELAGTLLCELGHALTVHAGKFRKRA
jgi:hypothetical protein